FGPTRVLNSVAGLEAAARPAEEIAADPTGDSGVGASGPAGEEGFLIGIDPSTYFQLVDIGNVVPSQDAIVDGTVSVQDTVAEDNGWEIGDTVRLWSPEVGEREYRLATTYDQPFGPPGNAQYVVTSATFDEISNTQFRVVNTLYAKSVPGTDLATVQKAIEEVVTPVAPVASVNDVGSFIDERTEQLEAFLNIIYVLLLLAVIVAVFGISITMSMSVYERTRELGLLRAIGMERRQVRQAVRWEAAVISLFGTMLGLAMGVLLAMAFVSGFSDRGVGTTLPWATLSVIVVGGALAGLIAARRPAKRAAELDILDAIAAV
ncbi:MAG TPA: FtsX-like permease family protein, partial [Microthrixaceae bacterium]|nr:FtsX-like permease family protein [Microthrixaceae bacterium]